MEPQPPETLPTPSELSARVPLTPQAVATTRAAREALRNVMRGRDPRLVAIVGPCSLHDAASALEFAERLHALADETRDALIVVMRAYVEKPRSVLGWKGLVNDPRLDGSCALAEGLVAARSLLVRIAERGVACATEFVTPASTAYLADAVAWAAIGARTAASAPHRELASALGMPVGFKNALDGDVQIAVDGAHAAAHPHTTLAIGADGRAQISRSAGNPDAHVVLRGGARGPNVDAASIAFASEALAKRGLPRGVLVDCSHANSDKTPAGQARTCRRLAGLVREGNAGVMGAMLEMHLHEGRQDLRFGGAPLRYGVSITDACLGFEAGAELLRELAAAQRSLQRGRRPLLTRQASAPENRRLAQPGDPSR